LFDIFKKQFYKAEKYNIADMLRGIDEGTTASRHQSLNVVFTGVFVWGGVANL
jgi:hypothetical protein